MTPSPQGDLCVAKLFPPRRETNSKGSASDPGHGSGNSPRVVRCEASRNLKWSITNTGVISPIYKLSLPSPDAADLPLFQISKPNPNANFWSMFYFAYAGHNIPPKRIEFGKIQKNPPGPNGGGTRISITGKTPEEKAVWQTLGEGNEDCVEWVVLCAALNLLEYVFVHFLLLIKKHFLISICVVMKLSKRQRKICRQGQWLARLLRLAAVVALLPSHSEILALRPDKVNNLHLTRLTHMRLLLFTCKAEVLHFKVLHQVLFHLRCAVHLGHLGLEARRRLVCL